MQIIQIEIGISDVINILKKKETDYTYNINSYIITDYNFNNLCFSFVTNINLIK